MITDYIEGKQTRKTACRKIRSVGQDDKKGLGGDALRAESSKDKSVVIQMDTTYWGRDFGLMVIKDMIIRKDAPSPRLPLRG